MKIISISVLLGLIVYFCWVQPTFVRSDDTASSKSTTISDTDTFELRGTIVHKDLEGGFFAIDGDDGRTYDPINLPEEFKKNALNVNVTARFRIDVTSI